MAINLTSANTYFAPANHPRASVWAEFSNDQKNGAIAHAKRMIRRHLCAGLNEVTTVDDDFPRHDIAVYEQALWLLENSPLLRTGREESPDAIASDPEQPDGVRDSQTFLMAPEALRWLVRGGTLRLVRG